MNGYFLTRPNFGAIVGLPELRNFKRILDVFIIPKMDLGVAFELGR